LFTIVCYSLRIKGFKVYRGEAMKKIALIIGIVVALGIITLAVAQDGGNDVDNQFAGTTPAPAFPTGLDWLNVPAPLTLDALRGKIVILDFWTYGCINCIHMIPVLEQIEAKYLSEVTIIGVHSAKFANEGKTDNIRQIVERYGLKHPVINDHDFAVWSTFAPYGVQAWPTFVVIDPRGNILAVQPGEIPFEAFDQVLGGMVQYFDSTNELKRDPIEIKLESDSSPNTALAFPGKVLADPAGNRLFITDTNHNRIIIADLTTYEVLDVIGNGSRGFTTGDYSEASFDKPQGLALDGTTLYVADTNNHAVRAVDLSTRVVRTIAGTGEQTRLRDASGPADLVALSSPWDVALGDGTLYIAMAGPHQIWALTLETNMIQPLIGSGREGLQDGLFRDADLAQPSGLFYENGMLYFADSESSSIRVADIQQGEVHTLAGPGENNLFDFGDVDGKVGTSRLQHALGVTGDQIGMLYVADTYNSKVKLVNPQTKEISTLFGLGGDGGFRDGGADAAEFDEPGGLTYANGKLYVADTNNQSIRVIDLDGKTVSTITFPNPEALQIGSSPTVVAGNSALGEQVTLPEQTVAAGDGEIVLNIALPDGYKLNNLAPFTSEWTVSGDAITIADADRKQQIVEPELPIRVPVKLTEGDDLLHGDLTIYYCEAVQESLCFIDQVSIDVPVTVAASGTSSEITLERTITPPQLPSDNGL
jgi:DNA-binding beta-propeller fold protein YncE